MQWSDVIEELGGADASWAKRAHIFSERFSAASDPVHRDRWLGFLEENAMEFPVETTLCAVHVARKFDPFLAARVARRLVSRDPTSHGLRYALADCLKRSPFMDDRLEALKNQLLARGMHLQHLLAQPNGVIEANELRAAFLDELRGFKDAYDETQTRRPAPRRLRKLLRRSTKLSATEADRLRAIPELANLPAETPLAGRVTVVVDTGAVTHRESAGLLRDARVRHISTASVLFELAGHPRVEFIPWGLHFVTFLPDPLPARVAPTKQRRTRMPVVQNVVALARAENAAAILTSDSRPKRYRRRPTCVKPEEYARWLDEQETARHSGVRDA